MEKKPAFETIAAYREELMKDDRIIKVTDFGAGSRVFKSDERKISAIAKNAGISRKRAFLLNKLTSYFNIESALELGTSVGLSSAAIAAGNNVRLTTLEGCAQTAGIAKKYFEKFGLENIDVVVGSFETTAPQPPEGEFNSQNPKNKFQNQGPDLNFPAPNTEQQTLNNKQKTTNSQPTTVNSQPTTVNSQTDNPQLTSDYSQPTTDLIYFDGNHQKEATLKYFHQLLPLAHNDSVFIFDDIHWSKGMEEAWEEIKSHPKVRVTIDSFFWGIVFFREEQEKEHFTLRL